jgi:predicted TIM-barrel fold metal-dependent hydrolase
MMIFKRIPSDLRTVSFTVIMMNTKFNKAFNNLKNSSRGGIMMIDLSQYPVIDGHCHPFLPGREDKEFYQLFNLSTLEMPRIHCENTLLYRKVMRELSRVLNCPFDLEFVSMRRGEEYSSNPSGYIEKLFNDAKIKMLILDTGYPSLEYSGYSVPIEEFRKLVKCSIKCIFRIEPLLFRIFKLSPPFEEMLDRYLNSLREAVKNEGYIGFKSVVAYRVGLRNLRQDENSARGAYSRLREKGLLTVPSAAKDPKSIEDERVLRGYLLCRAIEESVELDVPFQIHTGIGDSPIIDLRESNPLHLYEIISDRDLGKAKLVLVHAGYPYVEEAGYLANNYPNVYIDLSEMFPFTAYGMRDALLRLLYMAPTTKIMYGSDGYRIPEIFWISAIWGKKAISEALEDLVRSEVIDIDYAYKAGSLILSENSTRLYKI